MKKTLFVLFCIAALFVVFYALGVSAGREATQQREEDISMEHTH